eukprot:3609921-Alexandrium_andersonii.AAC.1
MDCWARHGCVRSALHSLESARESSMESLTSVGTLKTARTGFLMAPTVEAIAPTLALTSGAGAPEGVI